MRLLIAGLFLCPLLLNAQMQLGWRTDTYAGINSAMVNPALPARTPYAWDFNLGEASFFLQNNYAYLQNTSIPELLRISNKNPDVFFARDLPADVNPDDDIIVYDFYRNDSYYAQQLTSVLGPSFSFRVAPQTRIGLFTRWQSLASGKGLDDEIGYYQWGAIPSLREFTLEQNRSAVAAWGELGLNISQGVETTSGVLQIGLSLRRLWGQRAAYFVNEKDFTISKLTNAVGLEGTDFQLEAGFTNNITSSENFEDSPGRGWGADIGMLYQVDLGDDFYRWEFGFAILDIGAINFSESEKHQFNSTVLATTLTNSYENLDIDGGLTQAAEQFSLDVFGDNSASRIANEFTLRLPTTISAQATYAFNEWGKVEANIIAGVAPAGPSLTRNTLIAITPRVDRHWWSVALPVSMYSFDQARLGLAARLGPFFIGTDQIGSFMRKDQLSGADFYFGVKLFPLGFGGNGSKKGKKLRGKRRGGKDVECYKF